MRFYIILLNLFIINYAMELRLGRQLETDAGRSSNSRGIFMLSDRTFTGGTLTKIRAKFVAAGRIRFQIWRLVTSHSDGRRQMTLIWQKSETVESFPAIVDIVPEVPVKLLSVDILGFYNEQDKDCLAYRIIKTGESAITYPLTTPTLQQGFDTKVGMTLEFSSSPLNLDFSIEAFYETKLTTEADLEIFPSSTDNPIYGTSLGYKASSLDNFISSGANKIFLIKDLTVYHNAVVTQIWIGFANGGSVDIFFLRKRPNQSTITGGLLQIIGNVTVSSTKKGEKKVTLCKQQQIKLQRGDIISYYNKNVQGLIAYKTGKGSDVYVAEEKELKKKTGIKFNKINFPYRFYIGFTFKSGNKKIDLPTCKKMRPPSNPLGKIMKIFQGGGFLDIINSSELFKGLFIWLILNTILLVLLILLNCICLCCKKTKQEHLNKIEKDKIKKESSQNYKNVCPNCQLRNFETGNGSKMATGGGIPRTYFSIRDTPKALPRSLSIPGTSSSTPMNSLRRK